MGQRGFTLTELVMVIVLLGILAVYAAPRMMSLQTLNARGFHDETLALLRYAQKSAIAQRRSVCVAWTSGSATLAVDADRNATTGTAGCEANLTGPKGETPATVTARSGASYASVPTAFSFDGQGQPSVNQTVQVTGAAKTITVEATTGYVHD